MSSPRTPAQWIPPEYPSSDSSVMPPAHHYSDFTTATVAGSLAVVSWMGLFLGVFLLATGVDLPEGMVTMAGLFVIFLFGGPAPVCTIVTGVALHEQGWRRTAWLIALAGAAGFLATALFVVSVVKP